MIAPAPWRRLVPRHARTLGDISDPASYIQSAPADVQQAWSGVDQQLQAEYQSSSGAVNGAVGGALSQVNQLETQGQAVLAQGQQYLGQAYQDAKFFAQQQFANTIQQLGSIPGIDPTKIAKQAQQAILLGHTIEGATQQVENLIDAAKNGADVATLVQSGAAFTGTMIGVAVAAGATSLGIGAAIVGVVGAIVALMKGAGLLASVPQGGSLQVCSQQTSGSDVYMAQTYASTNGGLNFAFTVPGGCLGCYVQANGGEAQIEPSSPNWIHFPDLWANVPGPQPTYGIAKEWGALDQGVTYVIGNSWRFYFKGWSKPNNPGALANTNLRVIDAAFPWYRTFECLLGLNPGDWPGGKAPAQPSEFLQMLFQACKANWEYALNGLQPQPNGLVLLHCLRLWNAAHQGPAMALKDTGANPFQGPCGSYSPWPDISFAPFVDEAVGHVNSSADGNVYVNGQLVINMGPRKSPPTSTAITEGGAAPTTAKTVATAAAAGAGTLALGTVAYSWLTGMTLAKASDKLWEASVGRLWKYLVR